MPSFSVTSLQHADIDSQPPDLSESLSSRSSLSLRSLAEFSNDDFEQLRFDPQLEHDLPQSWPSSSSLVPAEHMYLDGGKRRSSLSKPDQTSVQQQQQQQEQAPDVPSSQSALRLTKIEYHLEKLTELLEQQQREQLRASAASSSSLPPRDAAAITLTSSDPQATSAYTTAAAPDTIRSDLVTKVNAQLRDLGATSSMLIGMRQTEKPSPEMYEALDNDRSLMCWSSALADQASSIGLSEEVADSLAIDSHRPWLPDKESGIELLDCFLANTVHAHPMISLPLAQSIRDSIYTPEFNNDKFFIQKLACASYMMIQALNHTNLPQCVKIQDGTPIENVLYRNMFMVLRDVRVLFVPSLINIQALFLASISAKQIYNPGLCWVIISHAARHCLDLGLHRAGSLATAPSTADADTTSGIDAGMVYTESMNPKSERSRLFWSCFAVDKVMSLTFGRSPNFQTRDCTLPVPPEKPFIASELTSLGYSKYRQSVEIAFMYDAIYTRLYSAAAEAELAALGPEGSPARTRRRGEVVSRLHSDADQLLNNNMVWINTVRDSGYPGCEQLADSLTTEINYAHRVCLTMIHRVQSSSCAESREIYVRVSRDALQLFKKILEDLPNDRQKQAATSWALVFQPFAPFFGVFNAIADNGSGVDKDDADLETLLHITTELEKLNKQASTGVVRRLLGLANEFTEVATEIISRRKWHLDQLKMADNVDIGDMAGNGIYIDEHKREGSASSTDTQVDDPPLTTATASALAGMFSLNSSEEAARKDETEICRESYSEAARQPTLPSWLEFLSDENVTNEDLAWLDEQFDSARAATGGNVSFGSDRPVASATESLPLNLVDVNSSLDSADAERVHEFLRSLSSV
ncbi:hypothetical protein BZA70DRAFT_271723 [Myxozyma melibiosi]|uniref:Xylanolytic transcriptional activator regulatory domain-containing protein n=1 Tax=Myxozyma melibiosi TaxID=54550 RepID=A0ABR1FCL9_9ASCO